MGGATEVVKGRIEEATGALIGSDKLREKGKADQAVGQAEQAVEQRVDQAKQAGREAVHEAKVAARKAVNAAKELAQKAVAQAQGVT